MYVIESAPHPLRTQTREFVYGQYLKPDDVIQAVKKPSFIKKVDYNKAVNELYETTISDNKHEDTFIKKLVANVNIGLLEKCFNKVSRGYLFQDKAECQHYQAILGGTMHVIQKIEERVEVKPFFDHGLDYGIEPLDPPSDDEAEELTSHLFMTVGAPLYVLVRKAQQQLKNGFRYIKELLMQHHNHKLIGAFDMLRANGIDVYSIKTDCFTIKATDLEKARTLLNFDNGIGSWRLSKTEDIIYPYENITVKKCDDFNYPRFESTRLEIKDEWDVNEMIDHFEEARRVMVRADFGGCGKTYACKKMVERGHKVLFACPTNKLAQNNKPKKKRYEPDEIIKMSGITMHSFFGVGHQSNKNSKKSKFDASDYDVIVF